MVTMNSIQDFLSKKNIAVIGASRNAKKTGYMVFNHLRSLNYNVYPVNPNATEIDGVKCFPDFASLPEDTEAIIILVRRSLTEDVVKAAIARGIRHIWMQLETETPEAIELCKNASINVIYKKCIMMFSQPKGIHKFHHNVMKFFGKIPKLTPA